ncbi:ferrioxamine B transporter [Paecilomyces lecythidis]|uniref:Ferrioxamine B transporter n=1 Tax=Paecilomyces lecythidis TaxID=3004212 RepID=A0ABR3XRV0_9EURO
MEVVDSRIADMEHGVSKSASETSPLLQNDDRQDNLNNTRHLADNNSTSPEDADPGAEPSARLSTGDRTSILIGILIIGWAFGLDSLVRSTYQSYAASSLGVHTLLSTINVLRSVIAAAVHPAASKIADAFGRFELISVSVAFYIVGTVIESTAESIEVFIIGAVLYQIGYTCVVFLVEVIIADVTSMRSRVFFSYIPAIPFLLNAWISGALAAAVLKITDWRWGIRMWAFIYAGAAAPLLIALYRAAPLRAPHADSRNHSPYLLVRLRTKTVEICQQLDIVGVGLMVAILTLILTPLTIAEGQVSQWRSANIIAPLVLGCLCIPAFIYWEIRGARRPFIPRYLLTDSGVGAGLAVRCLLNFAWAVQGNYLYTVLIIAFDFSITLATQITAFFTFFGVVTGVIVGLVIYRTRRLKYSIVFGTILFMVSFALLTRFPSGTTLHARLGMLSAQVLLGIAAGFCTYQTQASVQAATKHEHVSALTGVYLASFNIGSALGTCVSGVIWSENLLPLLKSNLQPLQPPDSTLAEQIYKSPFDIVPAYPVGTEIRDAIISSYGAVMRLLCLTGFVICVPMIAFALALKNPRLSTKQSQPEAGREDVTQ